MTLGTVNRMHSIRSFQNLQEVLAPKRAQVVDHPLHGRLATLDDVHLFMEHHVFAVWDFMSLLKSLQRELTCVEVPWIPRGDAASRRMVNEIVLGEESDEDVNGGYLSHFELYRAAMQQCGADSSRIDAFLRHVTGGISVQVALTRASAPAAAQRFVLSTFQTIESGSVPRIAAAFTLGREDIIPDMFRRLVADLSRQSRDRLSRFLDYIDRHRLDLWNELRTVGGGVRGRARRPRGPSCVLGRHCDRGRADPCFCSDPLTYNPWGRDNSASNRSTILRRAAPRFSPSRHARRVNHPRASHGEP